MKKCFLSFFTPLLIATLNLSGQEKGRLVVPGLTASVEIYRDNWGVNHIYAENEHDLFFAQGYCAVRDRLFQFELWRRQATGTLAELLGPRELKRDISNRLFRFRGNMDVELQHYHPRGKSIIQAYVDGVNGFIDEVIAHPEELPMEFRMLGIMPGKWTPSVVVSRHQGIRANVSQELNLARAVARIGSEKVKSLSWFHPKDPDLTLDSAIIKEGLFKDVIGTYLASQQDITFNMEDLSPSWRSSHVALSTLNDAISRKSSGTPAAEEEPQGSNNWVISGRRTASGFPILANDPHRKISTPSLRYITHLVAPGWNVIGGGEPVIPGVSIGHNEVGAWGLTIFETDAEDLYVYDLDSTDLTKYRYKDGWASMEEIREIIPVKGKIPEAVTLRLTRHGPVTFIDTALRKAYAIRCAWLEPGGAPYLASLRIDQAQNWEEFRDACAYSHIPGENMIWADRKGNIGWQAVGIAPIRNQHSGMVPVPGDGRFEWEGFLPIRERPHLLNPSKGFFATANQHVTPEDYVHWNSIAFTWADDYRGNRVNEVLQKTNKANMPVMKALQNDYQSLPARELIPLLQAFRADSPTGEKAREMLLKWNQVLDKNSIAAGIYVMWEREIVEQSKKRFVPAAVSSYLQIQTTTIIRWMTNPSVVFKNDPITERNLFLQNCFHKSLEQLAAKFGKDMRLWVYGQSDYKHVYIAHPFSTLVDSTTRKKLDHGPLPRSGYGHTPGATGNTDNQTAGASFRFIADLADWNSAVFTNTPGQSGNPESPFYRNLFNDWANDRYFPALYDKEKIRKQSVEHQIMYPVK